MGEVAKKSTQLILKLSWLLGKILRCRGGGLREQTSKGKIGHNVRAC
jgi:hypothetical protein